MVIQGINAVCPACLPSSMGQINTQGLICKRIMQVPLHSPLDASRFLRWLRGLPCIHSHGEDRLLEVTEWWECWDIDGIAQNRAYKAGEITRRSITGQDNASGHFLVPFLTLRRQNRMY